jgi:hypothetical protein
LKYFLTTGRILLTMFCIRSEATSWVWGFCKRSEEIGRAKRRSCVVHEYGRLLGCRLPSSVLGYKPIASTWV